MAIESDREITTPEEIGIFVRERRKKLGLTQPEVAERCGVSVKFVSEIELGKPTARVGMVMRLIAIVGGDIVLRSR